MIRKGYFSNGWKNNQVYVGESKNEVFRFRVENQPVSGKRAAAADELVFDGTFPELVAPVAGYDTRWDIFFHFQLDFYDSFDSQDGKPLRDCLWQRLDCSGYAGSDIDSQDVDGVTYVRIMGGIEADAGGMHVLPDNTYSPDSGAFGNTPTSSDPYSYQFAGRFSLLKTELPGELPGDVLPEFWNPGQASRNDDFNQLYYWRVCPYNVVKRPVFERELTRVDSIEFFGNSGWSRCRYWKAVIRNTFRGSFRYASLPGGDRYHIWIACRKSQPVWKRDSESACWNPREAFYENFFPGTDQDRMDVEYTANPARESYRARILRGEVVFLTDRPREVVEGALQYIEDTNNHFRSLWIPFNTDRGKPWMFFDAEERCWFLIAQKPAKRRDGYQEFVFTLSRGLSPQTFGEECQLFPESTMENADSVLEGALSFENPCVLKRKGRYEIFFNVRKEGGRYECWRAGSKDLCKWEDFVRLEFDDGQFPLDMAVYETGGRCVLYGVQGTAIRKYSSGDGAVFQFERTVYADMYTLTRPTLADGRIYFGMEFAGRGKIVSIAESGEYSSLHVEKGSPSDFESSISFNGDDVFFTPLIFNDFDKGTAIRRLVFRKSAPVHAYVAGRLRETGLAEEALFTEYCEEYSWEKLEINGYSGDLDYGSSSVYLENGGYYPILKDANGNKVNLSGSGLYVPVGRLELLFRADSEPLQVKIPFFQEPVLEDTESEGEWIDFHNAAETSAELSPENPPEDYDPGDYTAGLFIASHELQEAYDQWLRTAHPVPEAGQEENYRIEFLLNCKQYSVYLKWSRRGPGVYRYLNAVKRSSYVGDGSNVQRNQ